jgi:hypothetical protein
MVILSTCCAVIHRRQDHKCSLTKQSSGPSCCLLPCVRRAAPEVRQGVEGEVRTSTGRDVESTTRGTPPPPPPPPIPWRLSPRPHFNLHRDADLLANSTNTKPSCEEKVNILDRRKELFLSLNKTGGSYSFLKLSTKITSKFVNHPPILSELLYTNIPHHTTSRR